MKSLLLFAVIGVLLTSCTTERSRSRFVLTPPDEAPETLQEQRAFSITDHKNNSLGLGIPEWADRFLEGGANGLRAIEANMDSYMFIARSSGNNFNALNLWKDGFYAELDFPRLAGARIEARFSAGIHFPDEEYGAFYEALIRAVSDARWTGMIKEDDFWIQRSFLTDEEEPEREDWDFLILVSIGKTSFISQLNSIFQRISPSRPSTERQALAFNRVVERFFEGF